MSQMLGRLAVRRVHVLVAAGPGHWATRVRVEQVVLGRGWRLAATPAEADVLAVCTSSESEVSGAVEVLWDQMPGPRVRVDIPDSRMVEEALEDGAARLLPRQPHVEDARRRAEQQKRSDQADGAVTDQESHEGMGHEDHEGMDHEDHEGMDHGDHEGMDHGDHEGMAHEGHEGQEEGMDHEGHEGMDHEGMEMAPAGVPLAEGGGDRDGLEMDVLHLRLGPVLRHWPAGLVLRCSLQGDVIVVAKVSVLEDGSTSPEPWEQVGGRAVLEAARRCDNVSDVLALAGWQAAAATARGIRDSLVTEADPHGSLLALDRLHRRVERSRLLRWSLRGLGRLDDQALHGHELHPRLCGDVRDRLLSLLERARAAAARAPADADAMGDADAAGDTDAVLAALPAVVTGLDLAAARLVVASFGLEPLTAAREVARG